MAKYKTYAKEKWLYFVLAIVAFFLPIIITTSCMLPIVNANKGLKLAVGFAVIFLNSLVFFCGLFHSFTAHFPMLNIPAIVFLFLREFFTLPVFNNFADTLSWIELSAFLGSITSCVFWALYRKYSKWHESVKANIMCGAFVMKEDMDND